MEDKQKELLAAALKYLGYRARSQKEVLDFLHKKTQNETLINQTLNELIKLKLVNDQEFADWVVRSRSRNRGSLFIKKELQQKGIELKNIQVDDVEIALKLLEKKKFIDKDKAFRYLAYRGIPMNKIAEAWKKWYNYPDVK